MDREPGTESDGTADGRECRTAGDSSDEDNVSIMHEHTRLLVDLGAKAHDPRPSRALAPLALALI